MATARKLQAFLSMNIADLRQFLRTRGVPVTDEKKSELAERAFWAQKLGLPVKPTDEEAENEIVECKRRKLEFDGGMVRLPRPEVMIDGWEDGPASLPETTRDHLDSYIKAGNRRIGLHKTEGTRTLALGKGLYISGHIRALQYHGISPNLCYCFVRGKVVPQVKLTEKPYYTWVVLQKESGQVLTAECDCIIGIQATCKHVAGLLFAIVEAVEEGGNMSSTSQKQAWGTAPKKGVSIHQPQYAKDIKIIGVKADVSQQFADNKRIYRSEFDPRVIAHRVDKPISSFNLDHLASITNGNCGLLMYSKPKANPAYIQPDLNKVVRSEEVTTSTPALTVRQACERGGSLEDIMHNLEVSHHEQCILANETAKQSGSSLWAEHRIGRITSSVIGDCAGCVKGNVLSGHSQIARVMGYYGSPSSAALQWGKEMEGIAKKQYVAHHRLTHKHTGVSCRDTGLWISLKCPYIAASPDGIVACKQCGSGLLEIKNPYTHRLKEITDLAVEKGSCLETINGVVQLKRTHTYYAQVQCQMWATGYTWCDFVVRTVSKKDNFHVERVHIDLDFMPSIRQKLDTFFQKVVEEISTGCVEKTVRDNAVKKTMNAMLSKLSMQTPSIADSEYPCGVCNDECGDSSIGCDNCSRWFHYHCVGITGLEPFLKKRKSTWKCPACASRPKRRKRQR